MSTVPLDGVDLRSRHDPDSLMRGPSDDEDAPAPTVHATVAKPPRRRPGRIDIYDLDFVSTLPWEQSPSFITDYAAGRWDGQSTPDFTADMIAARPAFRRLESSKSGFPSQTPDTPMPPDLTKAVEDVYRSFILDSVPPPKSRLSSGSIGPPTPRSESNFNPFSADKDAPSFDEYSNKSRSPENSTRSLPMRGLSSSYSSGADSVALESYAEAVAVRYHEVGYLQAPMAQNEVQRRLAVQSFKPFHQTLDPNLDRIARLGKSMFSANVSLISLVDTDEVQFTFNDKDPFMVPRGTPMCSHAILQTEGPMVVLDTLQDWRFKGNTTVTTEWDVRFYAGYPLRTDDGHNIGVFCVLDNKPRERFTEEESAQLKELTAMTFRELDSRRNQRRTALRDRVQLTNEAFNKEAVSGFYSVEQLSHKMVDHIATTLSIEGVLVFDAGSRSRFVGSPGEYHPWQDRKGNFLPVLAASDHATQLSEISLSGKYNSALDLFFSEYPSGVIYNQGDAVPTRLIDLLPEGVITAAAVPVLRGGGEPFALVCVYSLNPDYFFDLPGPTLSFLSALGLVLCSVQQKQVLSLADKAKVDFIANISHELRTPLHGVMASCDLLSETFLSETQESFLSTAKQCASSLTETINHVLDFTKTTSQSLEHSRVPVDLAQLIEETMTGCWLGRAVKFSSDNPAIGELYAPQTPDSPHSDGRKMMIEPLIDIEPLPNWNVMVDKAGLRRILINVIGNSMKFTQEGYVKVGLYRKSHADFGMVPVEIVIEDTGTGMSELFIREKLFHPFSQERPFAQGIGLGLAIVRSILKSPGIDGTIDVHSRPGSGTRMIVRFAAPPAESSGSPLWLRNPSPFDPSYLPSVVLQGFPTDTRGSTLLASLLRQHLQRWYGPLEEIPKKDNTVLIVDGDTIDASELEEAGRQRQKILLLSSSPVNSQLLKIAQELSLNGGFCLVTLKPVGPHALARLMSKITDALAPQGDLASPTRLQLNVSMAVLTPKPTPENQSFEPVSKRKKSLPSAAAAPTRTTALRTLVVEDNPINRKVLSAYLTKRGHQFVEAENGLEGVKSFEKYPDGYFDICLMDLQMPVKDGFVAAADIREIESKRILARPDPSQGRSRMKIYALSGLASPEDKERASTIGFDGYLVKPVSFKTLDGVYQSLIPSAPLPAAR